MSQSHSFEHDLKQPVPKQPEFEQPELKQIVLASGNKGKLLEFSQLLAPYRLKISPQSQFSVTQVAETGTTFVENAIIKARHAAEQTGLSALSDDSGIEVDVLKGAPGIYSARYSGEGAKDSENCHKLLQSLKNETNNRRARFQCVLVYLRHALDPTPIICQASWEGTIATQAEGDNGHGYDPIFIPNHHNVSAAMLSSDEKNHLSHRGKALRLLVDAMISKNIIQPLKL